MFPENAVEISFVSLSVHGETALIRFNRSQAIRLSSGVRTYDHIDLSTHDDRQYHTFRVPDDIGHRPGEEVGREWERWGGRREGNERDNGGADNKWKSFGAFIRQRLDGIDLSLPSLYVISRLALLFTHVDLRYMLCLWMDGKADIEGRGLGELCTYDKMFSFKET
ncbi:hypothetical protein Tco_0895091 [Tanacetum coccineum]|uniref:Uncharacterized protein n=1 Tax=Tanacetum coccineum TaxID=301880 RepID=A0ABQ5CJW4_9ASTR